MLAERNASGPFDLNDLSGPQRALLREALLAAFTRDALDQTLQDNDETKRLDILVAEGGLRSQLFELVRVTQNEGWTDKLVAWAQKARPGNVRIKNLVSDLSMLDGVEGDPRLVDRSLERTVKARSDTMEFDDWLLGFTRVRRAVCRIEDPRDARKALGTGFLVGPDLLLTNYHVMESYVGRDGAAPKLDVSTLAFRFDYAIETTGENYGKTVPAAVTNWRVSHAPYRTTAGDATPDLDYVLVRLATPVGDDMIGEAKRGWLGLSSLVATPVEKDVVFIAQHPKGAALKMAVGTVVGIVGGHVRYNTETQDGTSGAPCLDATLQLVAIHQGSNSDRPKEIPQNEGIHIDGIINHLAANGVPRFWV